MQKVLTEQGTSAADPCAERVARDHAEEIRQAHEVMSYLAGILPVLGLLGTLLSLNRGLFVAFCSGTAKTESVMTFVTAFSTALDNTILAAFCTVPLFMGIFLLGRLENGLAQRYAAYVRQRFDLKENAGNDKATSVLQAELRRLTARLAAEASPPSRG